MTFNASTPEELRAKIVTWLEAIYQQEISFAAGAKNAKSKFAARYAAATIQDAIHVLMATPIISMESK